MTPPRLAIAVIPSVQPLSPHIMIPPISLIVPSVGELALPIRNIIQPSHGTICTVRHVVFIYSHRILMTR